MTQDEIIEAAIQGHASTRDAIRWAIKQERRECAKVCAEVGEWTLVHEIEARGEA
jgi:3-methyladenine DNA glycosylase AlkC